MALRNLFGELSLETTQAVDQLEVMQNILVELRMIRQHLEILTEESITEQDVENDSY